MSFLQGGVNLFASLGGGIRGDDDDLDSFVQYVGEGDDDEDDGHDDDHNNFIDFQGGEEIYDLGPRKVSFESDDELAAPRKGEGGLRRFFRSFERRQNNKQNATSIAACTNQNTQQHVHQESPSNLPFRSSQQVIARTPREAFPLQRPQSKPARNHHHVQGDNHDGNLVMEHTNLSTIHSGDFQDHHNPSKRSRSMPDSSYNESILHRMGSFEVEIDTIPDSPRQTPSIIPFTEENFDEENLLPGKEGENHNTKQSRDILAITNDNKHNSNIEVSTAMVPYATGGVQLLDQESSTLCMSSSVRPGNQIDRQDSWDRRLARKDIYDRHYVPSRKEIEELQQLEDYLGIFSTTTKHRFSSLWRELVPSLESARDRSNRQHSMQYRSSTSSMSSISSTTYHHHPPGNGGNVNSETVSFSIVLKRGPIQFEEYHDYFSEWILLTKGFVVARPNFQYIPRFQAGDLWTSVVQVQPKPSNPLSISISCTSRATSSHLTLAQLKQQQRCGYYTYEMSCETPHEQATWLEALRTLIVSAHDRAGTKEKERGGVGWQYRVIYVPFYTEAITGEAEDSGGVNGSSRFECFGYL